MCLTCLPPPTFSSCHRSSKVCRWSCSKPWRWGCRSSRRASAAPVEALGNDYPWLVDRGRTPRSCRDDRRRALRDDGRRADRLGAIGSVSRSNFSADRDGTGDGRALPTMLAERTGSHDGRRNACGLASSARAASPSGMSASLRQMQDVAIVAFADPDFERAAALADDRRGRKPTIAQ